jgi:hypothetical protein
VNAVSEGPGWCDKAHRIVARAGVGDHHNDRGVVVEANAAAVQPLAVAVSKVGGAAADLLALSAVEIDRRPSNLSVPVCACVFRVALLPACRSSCLEVLPGLPHS